LVLNSSPRTKISTEQIGIIIHLLQSLGKKVIFITNEPYEDIKVARIFSEEYKVEFVKNFHSYHQYMKQLAAYDFVISARLHTNILSLDTHTPIIPIDGNVFKSKELLGQLEYPLNTLDSKDAGWIDQFLKEINLIKSAHYDFYNYFNIVFPRQQQFAKHNAALFNEMD